VICKEEQRLGYNTLFVDQEENVECRPDPSCYSFASPAKGGYRTAQAWSPDNGTAAFELIAIARTLQKYPQLREGERKVASKSLTKMAKRLLAKIENTK